MQGALSLSPFAMVSISLAVVALVFTGCKTPEGQFPKGCPVEIVEGAATPNYPVQDLGGVRASCADLVSADECVRTLKDQVCKLGGDTLWNVTSSSNIAGGKDYSGRGAKRKTP